MFLNLKKMQLCHTGKIYKDKNVHRYAVRGEKGILLEREGVIEIQRERERER